MARPLNVLVCGTNWGKQYVIAVLENQDHFRLAGILSRGSTRSRELAAFCGVPHFTGVADLPPDRRIDVACVAVLSRRPDVVLQLLDRGISVVCEHPLESDFISKAQALARRRGVSFHVNAHFADLEAPARFVDEALRRSRRDKPLYVSAVMADRALYGTAEVLCRALGPAGKTRLSLVGHNEIFKIITGEVCGVPATFQVQFQDAKGRKLADGSKDYVTHFSFFIAFECGNLVLQSIFGPVIWQNRPAAIKGSKRSSWQVLGRAEGPGYAGFSDSRTHQNFEALKALAKCHRGGVAPCEQSLKHLLRVSETYLRIKRPLGLT